MRHFLKLRCARCFFFCTCSVASLACVQVSSQSRRQAHHAIFQFQPFNFVFFNVSDANRSRKKTSIFDARSSHLKATTGNHSLFINASCSAFERSNVVCFRSLDLTDDSDVTCDNCRSLMSQLQKLQSIASKTPSATAAGSSLMVSICAPTSVSTRVYTSLELCDVNSQPAFLGSHLVFRRRHRLVVASVDRADVRQHYVITSQRHSVVIKRRRFRPIIFILLPRTTRSSIWR